MDMEKAREEKTSVQLTIPHYGCRILFRDHRPLASFDSNSASLRTDSSLTTSRCPTE